MPNSSRIGAAFVPLTQAAIKKLRSAHLTSRQYDLLLFFWEQDKFGDRWVEFHPLAIMQSLEISKGCYYEAIAKLIKLGLLELRERAAMFRNPFGAKRQSEKSDSQSENLDFKSENLDSVSENLDSQPLEPIPEAAFTSPQTVSDSYKLSQSTEGERDRVDIGENPKPVEADEPIGDLTIDLTGKLGDLLQQFKVQQFRRAAAVCVCDRLKEEQKDFWEWMKGKAAKLPDPVRDVDLWAAAQIRDGVMAGWWCEWVQARECRARAIATAATSSTPEPTSEEEPPADRLTRLKAQWTVPNMQRMVKSLIEKNPKWGIELGDSGPQLSF